MRSHVDTTEGSSGGSSGSMMRVHLRVLRCAFRRSFVRSLPRKIQILLLTTLVALPGLQEQSLLLPETARDIHFSALDEVLTVLVRELADCT